MRETDRDRESRTDERRQNKIFAQKRTREANRTNHKKTKSGRCCVREKQQQQKKQQGAAHRGARVEERQIGKSPSR
jgi:hypothetical protein